jgi:sec-independent protein translocase protein TatA
MISEQASFLSPPDMIIVMIVALIVFGPQKLPEVGRQLGRAMRDLKKLTSELTDSINSETEGVKSVFDSVSPYKLASGPIDGEKKLSTSDEGYITPEAMKESPLLTVHSEASEESPKTQEISTAQAEAALTPLSPVTPKSGE